MFAGISATIVLMSNTHPEPDYDFIMAANHKPKKPILPRGNSKQSRIVIVVVGAVVLVAILAIVAALINRASSAGHDTLVLAAQEQTELIRISTIGVDKARDPGTKNLAVTAQLSLKSDQTALLSHVKVSPKELAFGKNTKTDIALTTAEQSNKFDEAFTAELKKELATYQKTLKTAYDEASSKKLKTTLSDNYTHANTLIGENKN